MTSGWFARAKSIVLARRERETLEAEGFIRVQAFAPLLWESPYCTHRVVEARIASSGNALYVKVERR